MFYKLAIFLASLSSSFRSVVFGKTLVTLLGSYWALVYKLNWSLALVDICLSWDLESSLDAGMFLVFLSALDPKVFCRHVAGVLLLNIGINLVFKGIIEN